jgi:hypothetical protein
MSAASVPCSYFPSGYFGPGYFSGWYWGQAEPIGVINIREALTAALMTDPTLASLIGDRIYPLYVPQTAVKPALAWQLVSLSRKDNRALDSTNRINRARFALSGVSKDPGDTTAVAEAMRQILDGFTGLLGTWPDVVTVVETIADGEQDFIEGPIDGTGRPTYRTVCDYVIRYREPLPARFNS